MEGGSSESTIVLSCPVRRMRLQSFLPNKQQCANDAAQTMREANSRHALITFNDSNGIVVVIVFSWRFNLPRACITIAPFQTD